MPDANVAPEATLIVGILACRVVGEALELPVAVAVTVAEPVELTDLHPF